MIERYTKKDIFITVLKLFIAIALSVVLFRFLTFTDRFLSLFFVTGQFGQDYWLLLLCVLVLLLFPKVRYLFVREFNHISHKVRMLGFSVLSVALGMAVNLFLYIYMISPVLFGSTLFIELGKNQAQYNKNTVMSDVGYWFNTTMISPFVEEFLFRFLFFIGLYAVPLIIVETKKPIQKLLDERQSLHIWIWILSISILFGFVHLGLDFSQILSFPLYFVPGFLFSWLFIKRGFLYALIAHMAFNAFSPVSAMIMVWLGF